MTRISGDTLFKAVADTDAHILSVQPAGPASSPRALRRVERPRRDRAERHVDEEVRRQHLLGRGRHAHEHRGGRLGLLGTGRDRAALRRPVPAGDPLKKRGIVLLHDVHSKTVDMVKLMVPTLKAEGYVFDKLQDAPAVKRAIANVSATPATPSGGAATTCFSSTLGTNQPENACAVGA